MGGGQFLGRHIIAELYGCDRKVLNDAQKMKRILLEAAQKSNSSIVDCVVKQFEPQGVSGVVIIAESHIAIHTWPEYGYAAVDVYTCGDDTNPEVAVQHIIDSVKAKNTFIFKMQRGFLGNIKKKEGGKIEKGDTTGQIQVLF